MRIAAALPNHHGSSYHRALVPLRALAVRGHHVALIRLADPSELEGADVLLLPLAQKERVAEIAAAFRGRGGRVVYEIDDLMRAAPTSNPVTQLPQFADAVAWIERIMARSDAVIASTPPLADAYREVNPQISVCRNALDPADLAPYFGRGEPERDGEVRLGWAGSVSHYADLLLIVEPVAAVLRELPQARFVLIGADFRRLFPADVRERVGFAGHTFTHEPDGLVREYCEPGEPWPTIRWYRLLAEQRLHVAIAPLTDDPFNRAKSDLKLLEYGALGIPAVASDVGPYREYVEGRGGAGAVRLAATPEVWYRRLMQLATDADERETLRQANRRNVLHHHLIYHQLDAWEEALAGRSRAWAGRP